MSIVMRQVINSLVIALAAAAVLPGLIFFVFPPENWRLIWEKELMDVPFAIVFPSLILAAGLIFGLLSGLYWRRRFQEISTDLAFVSQGRPPKTRVSSAFAEAADVAKEIMLVHRHGTEQAKLAQKLAAEKAADQEKRVQEIVARERNRLARELHDSVSQQLFAASMLMSAITETKEETAGEYKQLKLVESMIHQSQLEMRALLLHLRPVPLKGKTLQEGMEQLLGELEQKVPVSITWRADPVRLDKGIEDHLFRILQEAVSNTLRHAKADSIDVLLLERDGMAILRIADDGLGFESAADKTGSYGIQNMQERAVELGGQFKIVSVPGKGTRLEVQIPILLREEGAND